jgi:hypothetical protein
VSSLSKQNKFSKFSLIIWQFRRSKMADSDSAGEFGSAKDEDFNAADNSEEEINKVPEKEASKEGEEGKEEGRKASKEGKT